MPKQAQQQISRELQLARYWRQRTGLAFSDFDLVAGEESEVWSQRPRGQRTRREAMLFNDRTPTDLRDAISLVAAYVAQGFPLGYHEFHMAQAFGYLITDLPYEEFYKTRWYENADHRAYGVEEA